MSNLLALIVEDDKDLAKLFSIALQEAGFTTEIVYAGDDAQDCLETMTPDLVVLDLYLPHVGGGEILKQIHADPRLKDTKVLIVTAGVRAAEEYRNQADLTLVKPVDFAQLRELARRLAMPQEAGGE